MRDRVGSSKTFDTIRCAQKKRLDIITPPASSRIPHKTDRLGERLRMRGNALSPSLKAVAHYLHENRDAVLEQSALDIAASTGTSDATVIRAIQALGFTGLVDLKETLRSLVSDASTTFDKTTTTAQVLHTRSQSAIDFVVEDHMHALRILSEPESRFSIETAVSVLGQSKRIAVFGMGASGILATYAVRLFCRNGFPAFAVNSNGIALAEQLLMLSPGDALIMMAHQKAHPEAVTTIDEARRLDVPIVLITSSSTNGPLHKNADVTISVPRSRTEHIALHGPMLVCIEMLAIGLIGNAPERATQSVERMLRMRQSIRQKTRN